MATFYLDYELGSDAGTGADWANAWKTTTLGATSARIAPGDIIRIAKSPAPTSLAITGIWTDLSRTVTLASALTAVIEDCEDAWVASANVTATTSTTNKLGTNSCSLAIAAGFTTGIVAYEALAGSTDFSAHQQVSFWIRSSVAIAAGVLTLDLCSDTAGATPVNTIAIPAIPGINQWQVVTVDTAGALGNAIQSVSINAISDPGSRTILIDNIIACKAKASADSLTLSSLISKNTAEQGGTEGWFGIQSISGTTVILDASTNTEAGVGRGYSGTTETVTTYKRETIKTDVASSQTTTVQQVMDSGTVGSNIEFQGGYNTADSLQTGETFFDGQNGFGRGLHLSVKSFITLNYLNFSRYYEGVFFSGALNNTIINLSNANNNTSTGVSFGSGNNNIITTLSNVNNNGANGIIISTASNTTITTISNANSNATNGVNFSSTQNDRITTLSNANNNGTTGIVFGSSNNNIIKTASTSGNGSQGISNNTGTNYIFNALIAQATEVSGFTSFNNARIFSNKHDQTADNHWIFTDGGTINSQTTIRHTASGIAWKLSPTSADRSSTYPLDLSIAKIAVAANALVTVKCWFYKDSAAGITAKLICRGVQIAGVAADVVATAADVLNTWEELTITFTPTEAGVVEIEAWAYGGTANSVYVDDMTITQA